MMFIYICRAKETTHITFSEDIYLSLAPHSNQLRYPVKLKIQLLNNYAGKIDT